MQTWICRIQRTHRCLCIGFLLALCLPASAQNSLSLLTWSDYLDPDLVRQFEREFNARVEIVSFDNEDQRDRKMTSADGRGFDLILVNNNSLPDYIAMKWLAPIDPKNMDQFQHIDPRWLQKHDDQYYAIPYLWGTIGIAWRTDRVQQPPNDWGALYALAAESKYAVELMENHRDLMATAMLASGRSVNEHSTVAIQQASDIIKSALQGSAQLNNPILNRQAPLIKGDVDLAMMYNGDALFLAELEPNIRFTVPSSATVLWIDHWTLARQSRNRTLALSFLNFLNRPEIAARNSEYLHYATTNLSALQQLNDDVYSNPMIYPSKSIMENAQVIQAKPAEIQAHYQYWYHRAKYRSAKQATTR